MAVGLPPGFVPVKEPPADFKGGEGTLVAPKGLHAYGGGKAGNVFSGPTAKEDAYKAAGNIPGAGIIKNKDGSYSVWIHTGLEKFINDQYIKTHGLDQQTPITPKGFDLDAAKAEKEFHDKFKKAEGPLKTRISTFGEEFIKPKDDAAKAGKWIVDTVAGGQSAGDFCKAARAEVWKLYHEADQAFTDANMGVPGASFEKAYKLLQKAEARMADYERGLSGVRKEEVEVKGPEVIKGIKTWAKDSAAAVLTLGGASPLVHGTTGAIMGGALEIADGQDAGKVAKATVVDGVVSYGVAKLVKPLHGVAGHGFTGGVVDQVIHWTAHKVAHWGEHKAEEKILGHH